MPVFNFVNDVGIIIVSIISVIIILIILFCVDRIYKKSGKINRDEKTAIPKVNIKKRPIT